MSKIFLLIFIFCASLLNAQTDWVRWEAKSISYEIQNRTSEENSTRISSGLGAGTASVFRNIYKFLFSDLDGDNCPFHPSCSAFFVESVNETNLIQGAMMFADRFARDINFFKLNKYPLHKSGKFFDPAYNYSLNTQKIKYHPHEISFE